MPKGVGFPFLSLLSQLNKLACHHLLDQLFLPHRHPNDHACQETLYKTYRYAFIKYANTEDNPVQQHVHSGRLVVVVICSRGWSQKAWQKVLQQNVLKQREPWLLSAS
ncbi:TPA: hypothetical protein ACH3X1_014673 [Trebouxia sp. C0004]